MLVDEYEKPLLGTLNTPEVIKFRDALKSFYSVIKTKESLMRFTFITGISKFSKVSIFSDGKYALSGKRVTLIGISFSSEKRTIVEEIVEEMEGEGTRKGAREKVRR